MVVFSYYDLVDFMLVILHGWSWGLKVCQLNDKPVIPVLVIDVPKFFHVYHFCGVYGHTCPKSHKLKLKHFMFHSRICDDISPATSPEKLFHMLLKNSSLLACERKLQDFNFSQKKFVILQIHSASHGSSPTKPKTRAVWVRKDLLRWVLFTCPWFNSFNYLWTCFLSIFGYFIFLSCFGY